MTCLPKTPDLIPYEKLCDEMTNNFILWLQQIFEVIGNVSIIPGEI